MFVSVLNLLCIPQIGLLLAHGPKVKRLLIPRSVLLSGLLRIEEIENMFLTDISNMSKTKSAGPLGATRLRGAMAYHGVLLSWLSCCHVIIVVTVITVIMLSGHPVMLLVGPSDLEFTIH